MKKVDKTIVAIRKIPFISNDESIFPIERENEINSCKSEKTKLEKKYVWLLLQDVLKDYFGLSTKDLIIKKNSYGKWECNDLYFSLSHSEELVSVVVSSSPVGIDIQLKKDAKIERLILNEEDDKNEDPITLFSMKEALYKAFGKSNFKPKEISTKNQPLYLFDLNFNSKKYILSIVSNSDVTIICDNEITYKLKK